MVKCWVDCSANVRYDQLLSHKDRVIKLTFSSRIVSRSRDNSSLDSRSSSSKFRFSLSFRLIWPSRSSISRLCLADMAAISSEALERSRRFSLSVSVTSVRSLRISSCDSCWLETGIRMGQFVLLFAYFCFVCHQPRAHV